MAGLFDGLLGGDSYDLYGDILTEKQRAALQGRGLLAMAGAFAEAAKPSLLPTGGIGRALGMAASALGEGQDKSAVSAMNATLTAQKIAQAKQQMDLLKRVEPIAWKLLGGGTVMAPANQPPAPGAQPVSPVTTTAPGGRAPTVPSAPAVSQEDAPPGYELLPGGKMRAIPNYGGGPPAKLTLTGLLGEPDQVISDNTGLLQESPAVQLASYGGGNAGTPPFLRAAFNPGAGGDILDTVEKYESGGRNVHQGVVSPDVSSAQGYYQITNPTWRDTAPKAGVDLSEYPNAMSAPKEVQRAVAERLYSERGAQPWADFNPALARAIGYAGASARGEKPADIVLPSGGGGGDLQALMALTNLATSGDEGPTDALSALQTAVDGGGGGGLPIQKATASLAPYATGNAVLGGPSSVAGVGPEMSSRIEQMVQAMPPDVRERFLIISGFRDAQRQAQVNPGVTNSRHMHGAAVDLAKDPVVLDWINQNPQYGLGFPLQADPREINHLEMLDSSGGRLPIMQAQYSPGGAAPTAAAGPASPTGGIIPGTSATAQQLAALNALFKMGGVDNPFGSLLETYYKSPQYLEEAARAGAKGRITEEEPFTQRTKMLEYMIKMREDGLIVDPVTGNVTEDPNFAGIKKRRADELEEIKTKYQKQLDTFREQIEIEKEARGDKREIVTAPVMGEGGTIGETSMTREEKLRRLKDQSMRPGEYRPGDIVTKPIGGTAPPGYEYRMTPKGDISAVPTPGTPEEKKATDAANKEKQAEQQRLIARDVVVYEVDNIKKLMDTSTLPTTGAGGAVLQHWPGTNAYDVGVSLRTLKSRLSQDAINQMRAASPTGAAMGNVSDTDMKIVETALADLDQAQSEAQFRERLERVKQVYVDAVHGPGMSRLLPETPVVKPPASAAGSSTAASAAGSSTAASPTVPTITSEADYNKLPSGATFIAPNGSRRIKP